MGGSRVELWGFPMDDVEAARRVAERLLGVSFRLFESDTIGPYLFAVLGEGAVELTLRPNLDPDFDPETDLDVEDALAEPDFDEFGVLLYAEWHGGEVPAARAAFDALCEEALLLAVEEEGNGES